MSRPSLPFSSSVAQPIDAEVKHLIQTLDLAPHPEGGFFKETFRSPEQVIHRHANAARAASTAIYFLLPRGSFSAFHRVRSDEVWHHYDGGALELHTITERAGASPEHAVMRLGRDFAANERPQFVVRAGVWQAALPVGDRYSLCGCTVAPGFDFADFDLPKRDLLVARYPEFRAIIERLTNA